jgi:subtilisin-like proprotein convertase family protein
VGGLTGSVTDVNVTVSGLSQEFPDDVGLLLVSPTGQSVILMTNSGGAGGVFAVSDIDLTFDDEASGPAPDNAPLVSGTSYQPSRGTISGCFAPESFPTDAAGTNPPAGPYGSTLSVFDGSDPNGIWKLYVIDDSPFDPGSITGWSLDISTTTAEDTTPPTVTTSTPTNKAANVTATFSEEVQNVTPSTFFLERQIAVKKSPAKYVLVDATASLENGIYVLDPVEDLPKGKSRATITTDVTDLVDNALEDPVVWTFTVAK